MSAVWPTAGVERASLPAETWRALEADLAEEVSLPRGLDRVACALAGAWSRRSSGTELVLDRAPRLQEEAAGLRGISDEELRLRAASLFPRARVRGFTTREADTVGACGIEVVRRTLGFELHAVQIAAALALHEGRLVELATGEGKTVTAAMAALLHAPWGRGCHVVTSNDYLAARDAEAMVPVLGFVGLRSACLQHGQGPAARWDAYAADVTYGTHKEMAADYLRDRLALGAVRSSSAYVLRALHGAPPPGVVRRGFGAAIVDEADSILIDDAQTPLLISRETQARSDPAVLDAMARLARNLDRDRHFAVDEARGTVALTTAGHERLARTLDGGLEVPGLRVAEHLLHNALRARLFFRRDDQYVLQDDGIVIVDEATGRPMPDRSWRDGLHQAVEAQEGVALTPVTETAARVSFQRYFGRYPRLCGMTGTAWEARRELYEVYGLSVCRLPTHRPCLRAEAPLRIFARSEDRFEAAVREIAAVHRVGRPVLVGTRSVQDSELVAVALAARGIPHRVLNARHDAQEATIVAEAGRAGCVTVATNMAGRGTDIGLGPGVAERGGLHVVATQVHGSGRIDRQLEGRAGRQGDPGSAVVFASLEDELFTRFATAAERALLAQGGSRARVQFLVRRVQRRAESRARSGRRAVLLADEAAGRSLGFVAG